MNTDLFIGTCGWDYAHWRNLFYPSSLRPADRLCWYASRFRSVEVDATFYRLPSAAVFRRWHDAVPEGFRFSLKAPRTITHYRKLAGAGVQLATFYRLTGLLGEKRGAHLFQLPPSFHCDDEHLHVLAQFLELLDPEAENAIEFRHAGWWNDECFRMLRRHGVAFCSVDGFGLPGGVPLTAEFAYRRFHATDYGGDYPDEALRQLAVELDGLSCNRVYAYFNNDAGARAVSNAHSLMLMLPSSSA